MSNENVNPLKSLERRFPYQFKGKNIGIDVARGWVEVFDKLCEDIDQIAATDPEGKHYGFCWRQVKEKFGTARLYFRMNGAGNRVRVDFISSKGVMAVKPGSSPSSEKPTKPRDIIAALVAEAEAKLGEVCIVCGSAPAELDQKGGYLLNLCAHHVQQRHAPDTTLDPIWFDDPADFQLGDPDYA